MARNCAQWLALFFWWVCCCPAACLLYLLKATGLVARDYDAATDVEQPAPRPARSVDTAAVALPLLRMSMARV